GTLAAASVDLNGAQVDASLATNTLRSTGATALNGTVQTNVVQVTGGTLTLGAAERLSDTAAVDVAAGATLALGGAETIGSLAGAGSVALGADTLATGAGASSTFSGTLAGSGGLAKQGTTTTFTLTGNSGY